jgi:hypothetical protein
VKNKKNGKILNINKNNNDKERVNTEIKDFFKVTLELHKTDIYLLEVEVPLDPKDKDNKEINKRAIMIAWNVINNKLIDLEKCRVGDAFKNKLLGRKLIKNDKKEIKE